MLGAKRAKREASGAARVSAHTPQLRKGHPIKPLDFRCPSSLWAQRTEPRTLPLSGTAQSTCVPSVRDFLVLPACGNRALQDASRPPHAPGLSCQAQPSRALARAPVHIQPCVPGGPSSQCAPGLQTLLRGPRGDLKCEVSVGGSGRLRKPGGSKPQSAAIA